MLDFEYALFTKEDPIEMLVADARAISLHKRWKAAPHIRRAAALCRQSKKFSDLIQDDNAGNLMVGLTFCSFFGEVIDRNGFVVISRDVAYDYAKYFQKSVNVDDDKYMRRIVNLIQAHSKEN